MHSMSATTLGQASLGRRDRKKLATRQALRRAALALVAERGFDHVTVEDIAEAADVSTRTFFNYFASKEEAVVGMDSDRVDRLRQALAARPAGEPPLEILRSALGAMAAELGGREQEWLARMKVVRENPGLLACHLAFFATFERLLAEEVAARTDTDPERDLYPALAAAAAMSALRAAVQVWRASEGRRPLPGLLTAAFDQLGAGLPPPRRRAAPRRSKG